MPRHCFTYGSLMCDDIMAAVSATRAPAVPAVLTGYRRRPVLGQDYPGMQPDAAASVDGVLYLDLPDSAWPLLDAFEGDEYRREQVCVELADGRREAAWTYVFKPEYVARLADGEWDFQRFLQTGRARFAALYLDGRDAQGPVAGSEPVS